MADINQNVNYEITAQDKTGEATDSALANLIRQEQAAKKANQEAQKQANESKGLFAAITNALSGNFQALGEQVARAAAKLGGFKTGPMMMGAIGLAVTGVLSAVKGLADAFKGASDEERALKDMQLADSINGVRDEAKGFADEMERARSAAADQRKLFDDDIQCIREMTKAQNEFIKQQELAMAKTQEERDAIERRHARNNAQNDAYLDEETRQREIKDAQDEVERLEKELANAEAAKARANKIGKGLTATLNGMQNRSGSGWNVFLDTLTDQFGITDRAGDEATTVKQMEESAKVEAEAAKRVDDLRQRLEAARHRVEMANRREEIAVVQDAAKDQEDLNEDWRIHDEQAAKAEEERVSQVEGQRIESERKVKEIRLEDIADLKAAEQSAASDAAAARTRLAAAQAQVQRAWGWYRDKDSMAAQLEEEKANAEAERQYEKDFQRLKDRRPDWEKAKNLSVDQEAVKRVALARREEEEARRAVAETAANTARAAASLEAIERAFQEEGE